jgi:hypothetical protein
MLPEPENAERFLDPAACYILFPSPVNHKYIRKTALWIAK